MSTPRTDKHQEQMEVEDLDVECSETYHLARELERENNELRQALSGRTVSCSNCNDLAAENAAMREAIKAIYRDTEGYADGAPDAAAHDKLCNEISSKLQPYLK